jgi:alpha-L-fucosidase
LDEDGSWQPIAKETTIGYKRIVHVPLTTTSAVRVNIEESEACPVLNGFALYMDDIYESHEMSNLPVGEVKSSSEPLVTDLGEKKSVRGFVYAPKLNGEGGVIVDYKIEISDDGISWTAISPVVMFNNIINNPVSQEVTFTPSVPTRFLRIVPLRSSEVSGNASADSPTYGVSHFGCLL